MATKTIKEMLGNLPLREVDAVRLFVEAVEEGGLLNCTKYELIERFRKMVRSGVEAMREAERTEVFGEVVRMSLEARKERRKSTIYDLRSYAGRMVRYGDWARKPLRGIGVEECREMLFAQFGHSPHALRKARTILHGLFAFGIRQGWCDRNPVDAIEVSQVVEKPIEPLTEEQSRRLMDVCKEPDMKDMQPAVVLMLWCGVRPGEVRRLRWSDIDQEEGVVYIEPRVSKTGGARVVELRGAARALQPPQWGDPAADIAPPNWDKRWRCLRERAGLHHWRQDTLRHTFASMHLRHYRNPLLLQAEMGHRDSTLLRTRYLNLRNLSAESARRFWSLHT